MSDEPAAITILRYASVPARKRVLVRRPFVGGLCAHCGEKLHAGQDCYYTPPGSPELPEGVRHSWCVERARRSQPKKRRAA